MGHKKYVLCIFHFFVLLNLGLLFAKEYSFENIEWITTLAENYSFINGDYCESICDLNENWSELRGKYTVYEENTYIVAEINFETYISKYYIFTTNDRHLIMYDTYRKKQIECTNSKYHVDEPWIWPIMKCSSSSFLKEQLSSGLFEYKPENLTDSDISKNWVEGVDGYGIGEYLILTNDIIPIKEIYIINGFFCPTKTSLFYANGRVKKLLIQCLDSEGVVKKEIQSSLDDTGKLQEIDLGENYNCLKLIILEVYQGNRFQDTAISSIFVDGLSSYRR